jgi:hypothetical protein
MKKMVSILTVVLISHAVSGEESVSVPWSEFKALYGESIERRVMASVEKPEVKTAQVHSIEEAVYALKIEESHVTGEILISGRIISGDPEAIKLFGGDVVIAKTRQVTGGSLIVGQSNAGGVAFLPDGETPEFQIEVLLLVPVQEDSTSRFAAFAIPAALKNGVQVELADRLRLVEEPGIVDPDGVYHFSATQELKVRFRDEKSVSASSPVEIDTFSHVRLQGKRAIISTVLVATQPWPGAFVLQGGAGTHYVGSSLRNSWITPLASGAYEIEIPPDFGHTFSIQMAVEESGNAGSYMLCLPSIEGNNGREGDFVLEEPDDGRISLEGQGLVEDIPVARLGQTLARVAGDSSRFYMHISEREPFSLNVERFRSVDTPDTILDTQRFFISFEENGNVLSVLSMDMPADIGPRMELKAVPQTEIWSLKVNGQKRKVYSNDAGMWIIPLETGKQSHVELALLRKGDALGLHGRLEAMLPATGIPSRRVDVGIALPSRVQLLSLEGPLSPASPEMAKAPLEFVGQPYFFSRSLYKGQGMAFAVAYKEPVKQVKQ